MSELSELNRVTSDEIPEAQRWQIHAAWGFEYNRIKRYIEERANHYVGARMQQEPSERAVGAKIDGKGIPQDVNAIYGAMTYAVDADVIGKAARGELHRIAPSPSTVRLLGIGTIVTFILEISIFLIMWLMGQGGNMITVGVGVLLAGFGYLTGEGLGRLLIANDDNEQTAGILAWIFLLAGFIGVTGMTLIRYLAARAAAEEGEEVAGLIALVVLTTLLALAIAVFHAAHMERSNKRQRLIAQMFSAQLYFATQQARQSYLANLWTTLYDQAVEALVAGRPMPTTPEPSLQIPPTMFTPPPDGQMSPPVIAPQPKTEQ